LQIHRISVRAVLVGVFALITFVPSMAHAQAAITASSISSPASGTQLYYNGDIGAGSVTVTGTVVGASADSRGDLLCYYAADTAWDSVASGIPVGSGSFAVTVSVAPIAGFVCRLALVPAGTTPTGPAAAPFAGPALSVTRSASHATNGSLYGYDVLAGPLAWSFELASLGECPVFSSWATNPSILGSFQLFAGNACLAQSSGIAPNLQTRSGLLIDGLNAYPPGAIGGTSSQGGGLTGEAGFQPLSYSAAFNAAHDAVAISETDTPVVCGAPGGFPPTPTNCPSLQPSGIQIQQTTTLLPGGQVARVSQRFASVDGRAHTVDLLFNQSVAAPPGAVPGFAFPGQSLFASHSSPDSFSAFPSVPGTIFVLSNSAAQPAISNPVGAITYSQPPVSANFTSASGSRTASFVLQYTEVVPANGAVSFAWSFSQAADGTTLTALERVERDRFFTPSIAIVRPANRSTSRTQPITVTGRATDSVGLSSLTVNGVGAVIGANGAFKAVVRLRSGANVITATATNLAGNPARASRTVKFVPYQCRVPTLRGKKLSAARKLLARSHCGVGKIKRIHSSQIRNGSVIASEPKARTTHRLGTKVRLTVSRGP
jgi:hypothetical protein